MGEIKGSYFSCHIFQKKPGIQPGSLDLMLSPEPWFLLLIVFPEKSFRSSCLYIPGCSSLSPLSDCGKQWKDHRFLCSHMECPDQILSFKYARQSNTASTALMATSAISAVGSFVVNFCIAIPGLLIIKANLLSVLPAHSIISNEIPDTMEP